MMEKDSFINWYKERFDKLNEVPPQEVWNSISENMALVNLYKQHFNKINGTPPEEIWNSISEKLSINEAWQNVEAKLASNKRKKVFIRRSSYASLLLLISFSIVYFILTGIQKTIGEKAFVYGNNLHTFNSKNTNKTKTLPFIKTTKRSKTVGITPTNQLEQKNPLNKTNSNSIETISVYSNETTTKKSNIVLSDNQIKNSENSETSSGTTNFITKESQRNNSRKTVGPPSIIDAFVMLQFKNISILSDPSLLSISPDQISCSDSVYTNIQPSANAKFKGWYAGGVCSVNNIWLLNNQTINGFKSTSLDQTNINSGNSYGLSAGYGFNNNWAAELNLYLNSHQGQTYHVYEEGRCLSKNTSLNYTVVTLLARQRKTGYTKWFSLPKSHGLVAGINYGYLKTAEEISGQNTENTKNDYHASDFGLRLGYGYEVLVFKRILFSGCIQANIGLNNIYSGTSIIPQSFNRTHTGGFGTELGIKYLFR